MKNFLKIHLLGIILSVIIGAIISAPPIIFHFSADYKGMEMLKTNTETHYLGQVQELYDGHYGLGNPYLATDLKNQPYLFPPLGVYLTFGLGKLLFLDTVHAEMVLRFFFTGLLAFLVYFFTCQVTKRRDAGLVAAPFVLVAYSLADPANIVGLLRSSGLSIENTFIDYGRPITPQIASIFFFSYLIFLWRSLYGSAQNRLKSAIAAAVTFGLSFYVYLFTWTFIFSFNGFLFFVYALKKDWKKVKLLLFISLGAIFLSIPYLFHTFGISQNSWYAEVSPRFGFVKSHTLNISRMVLIALALFLLSYCKLANDVRLFFLAFFGTALFVVNEQVITGQYIFNHHFHWYYNTPLVIIVLVLLVYTFLPRLIKSDYVLNTITGVIVFVFLSYGIVVQISSYRAVLPAVVEEQRYVPLISWLNRSAPKDSVVFVPLPLGPIIPATTPQNVYYTGNALYTLTPDERLLHSYLIYTYLEGVSEAQIRDYLEAHRADISGFAYGYTYYFQKNVCTSCFPDSVIDNLVKQYQTISDDNFIAFLKQYPIDYIVWDKINNPTWRLDRFGLPVKATLGVIVVYGL